MDSVSIVSNYLKKKPNCYELARFISHQTGTDVLGALIAGRDGVAQAGMSFVQSKLYRLTVVFVIKHGAIISYNATLTEIPTDIGYGAKAILEIGYVDTRIVVPQILRIH